MSATFADVVLLVGAIFTLLAGVGALRFPDLYSRMHAATKATAFGFTLIAIGADIQVEGGRSKLLLAIALVLLTSPVAAHMVGRLSYRAPGVDLRIDEHDELAAVDDHEPEGTSTPEDHSSP